MNQELIKVILEKHGIELTDNLSNAIDEIVKHEVQYQLKQESSKLADKQRLENRRRGIL